MERKSFLRALGLLGASAVIPIDLDVLLVDKTTDVIVAKPIGNIKVGDWIKFMNGVEVRIVSMINREVRVTPVYSSVDIGNGCGASVVYDKDTLPEIDGFIRMFNESSSN